MKKTNWTLIFFKCVFPITLMAASVITPLGNQTPILAQAGKTAKTTPLKSDKEKKTAPAEKKKTKESESDGDEKKEKWILDTIEFGINRDRKDAIQKILTIKDKSIQKRLATKLVDLLGEETDTDVAVKAINVLSELKDTRAQDGFMKRLDDNSEDVRTAAVYGLKSINAVSAKEKMILKLEKEDLSKHGNFTEALLSTLGSFKARELIPFTEKAIKSDKTNKAIREYLVLFLGNLECPDPKDLLLKIYKDEDEELSVRSYAVNSLAKLKLKETAKDIKEMLTTIEGYSTDKRKNYYNLYIYSVGALATMGDKEAIPKLMSSLRSDNAMVRYKAIMLLKDLKSERTIDILKYRLKNDPSQKVRKAAKTILKEFGVEVEDDYKSGTPKDEKEEE